MPTSNRRNSALVLTLALGFSPQVAFGMGGSKPPAEPPAKPPTCDLDPTNPSVPNPIRRVALKPVGTMPFQLPNGSRVDLAADLNAILKTAVASTDRFMPTDPPTGEHPAPCGQHLEVEAAVSTLELNAFELGFTFGYSPSGPSDIPVDLNGRAKVKLGTVAMDFSVRNCVSGQCTTVAASTSSAVSAGVGLSMEIDFSTIKTGTDLMYNSPLSGALRSIMLEGMKQLTQSPHLTRLAWQAHVREYMPEAGLVIFDAGSDDKIAPNQLFEVYAVTPSSGSCDVYKVVAYLRTTQVNLSSSTAEVVKLLDTRGIKDGDIVRIRTAGTNP